MNVIATATATDSPTPSAQDATALWARTRRGLRGNLVRVMSVLGDGGDGPARMTQTELTFRTGIARSTLAKFLSGGDDSAINPDLQTLCRLGGALNVPPALLLMSTQDWTRLLSAISGLLSHERLSPPIDLGSVARNAPRDNVARALELAMLHGLLMTGHPDKPDRFGELDGRWQRDIDDLARRQRMGITAASALPEWRAFPAHVEALFVLCTLLGAATSV